jgi:transposase InsO family protein
MRVWHANMQAYGADKVRKQTNREGIAMVRCTIERLAEAGIEPSVGSYDNALAETINRLYKAELIHRRAPWKTRESVAQGVTWFQSLSANGTRRLCPTR